MNTKPVRPNICALVPAFNEADRISGVLSVLQRVNFLNKVIVVDDGSTDATSAVVQQFTATDERFQLIVHPVNLGKGQAVFTGLAVVDTPLVLLIDADLQNLKQEHIYSLVMPVFIGNMDMTLGVFRNGKFASDFSHWATPWLTGQRCIKTRLLSQLNTETAAGYGFEMALTLAAMRNSWAVQKVYWYGVSHPPSETHRSLWKGLRNRGKMYHHILRAWMREKGWQVWLNPNPRKLPHAK